MRTFVSIGLVYLLGFRRDTIYFLCFRIVPEHFLFSLPPMGTGTIRLLSLLPKERDLFRWDFSSGKGTFLWDSFPFSGFTLPMGQTNFSPRGELSVLEAEL
ncbi:unnamed protein product [Prunus brigantina]